MQQNETCSELINTYAFPYQSYDEIWKKLAKDGVSQIMNPNLDVSRDAGAFAFW